MKGFRLEIQDLTQPSIDWWVKVKGVAPENLVKPSPVMAAKGHCADDGRFDPDPIEGKNCFTFEEENDRVFWHPPTGRLATWEGRSFALGEVMIDNPTTTAFDQYLNIYADPVEWIRAGRYGIVVINWGFAFDRLRDVTRIAVAQPLLATYRKSMYPTHMPKLAVLPSAERLSA